MWFATIGRGSPIEVDVRFLFLLLLLANLLFLAWTRWVAPGLPTSDPVVATANAPALQPIRLQQEVAGDSRDPTTASPVPGGEPLAATACVAVGPFLSREQAQAAERVLARLGFQARIRAATDDVRVGTWVRVPDFATPADAGNALAALRAAGLADAYVVSDAGPGTVVSVGVYADPQRAAEAARAVTEAGFTPEMGDRRRTLGVHWLDIDRRANGSVPTPDEVSGLPEGGLPLELRACPAAAGAG